MKFQSCSDRHRILGHESGGRLTEAILRKSHSLILFDEVEKAHKDVFNLLLQILDDGIMTDGKARTVNFKHTIIIMTANIGGHLSSEQEIADELKKFFKPEFLNRLDEFIIFQKLGDDHLMKILDIMLDEISKRIRDTKSVKIKESFKKKLVLEGNCPTYGARPLRRAITRHLEDTLAENFLRGKIKEGDNVFMEVDENGEVIMNHSYSSRPKSLLKFG
ncbi:hypothetical protein M9H77_27877 [Catharanthus roseus]|uniref:Uncharacterized protein n=1 Tax=Catharanthus roseus TaxID=4058 RepID=A0ACC0AFW9_CATRO|nr:hypothetical protein M9H77_27877 [Catharanthus roseus]